MTLKRNLCVTLILGVNILYMGKVVASDSGSGKSKVCITNADTKKRDFTVAGVTSTLYSGEIHCFSQNISFNSNGKYNLEIQGERGSVKYELYSLDDDKATQYWRKVNSQALDFAVNTVARKLIPGASAANYLSKIFHVFGVDTPDIKIVSLESSPPSQEFISYIPTSSSGPFYALFPYNEVKNQPWGPERFSWAVPEKEESSNTCGPWGIQACDPVYLQVRYTGAKNGQIMTMHRYTSSVQGQRSMNNKPVETYVNYGSDAIYLCYNPMGDSGWATCSSPAHSKLIAYDEPGSNEGGDIVIYNNSGVQASFVVSLSDGRLVGTGFIQPEAKYTISKAAMNATSTVLDVAFTTKGDGQFGTCLYGQPYKSTDADLHISFNYNFSNPPSYFGPYTCLVKGAGSSDQLRVPVYKKVAAAACPASSKSNKKEILGYYPNYAGSNGFQPFDISCDVDTILYSFVQIGDCNARKQGEDVNKDVCVPNKNENNVIVNSGIQDYKVHSTDPWVDYATPVRGGGHGNIATTLATGKKVLPSIAGWSLSAPLRDAIKDDHRATFIQSIIDWMLDAQREATEFGVSNKFSGVDIDWEPNENMWTLPKEGRSQENALTKNDLNNFKNFLRELKLALTKAKEAGDLRDDLLTMAMTSNPMAIRHVDSTYGGKYWKSLVTDAKVDHIGLMTYDYFAPGWYPDVNETAFNAPIYLDRDSSYLPSILKNSPYNEYNINSSVYAFVDQSEVPAEKVVIGAGAYGRMYAINFDGNYENPYQREDKTRFVPGPRSTEESQDNSLFTVELESGKTQMGSWISYFFPWDGRKIDWKTGSAYAIGYEVANPNNKVFVTYDNFNSGAQKMSFAKGRGLFGVMLWDLSGDYKRNKIDKGAKSVVDGLVEAQ